MNPPQIHQLNRDRCLIAACSLLVDQLRATGPVTRLQDPGRQRRRHRTRWTEGTREGAFESR